MAGHTVVIILLETQLTPTTTTSTIHLVLVVVLHSQRLNGGVFASCAGVLRGAVTSCTVGWACVAGVIFQVESSLTRVITATLGQFVPLLAVGARSHGITF